MQADVQKRGDFATNPSLSCSAIMLPSLVVALLSATSKRQARTEHTARPSHIVWHVLPFSSCVCCLSWPRVSLSIRSDPGRHGLLISSSLLLSPITGLRAVKAGLYARRQRLHRHI